MAEMGDIQGWVQAALGGTAGATGMFLALRRKFSKDSAAMAQDKAEVQLIATLIAERDAAMRSAREAWEQRTTDARSIARFEALMEAGERETARLRDEIFAMRLHTRKLTAIIVRLDPQAASLLHVDPHSDGMDHVPVQQPAAGPHGVTP